MNQNVPGFIAKKAYKSRTSCCNRLVSDNLKGLKNSSFYLRQLPLTSTKCVVCDGPLAEIFCVTPSRFLNIKRFGINPITPLTFQASLLTILFRCSQFHPDTLTFLKQVFGISHTSPPKRMAKAEGGGGGGGVQSAAVHATQPPLDCQCICKIKLSSIYTYASPLPLQLLVSTLDAIVTTQNVLLSSLGAAAWPHQLGVSDAARLTHEFYFVHETTRLLCRLMLRIASSPAGLLKPCGLLFPLLMLSPLNSLPYSLKQN